MCPEYLNFSFVWLCSSRKPLYSMVQNLHNVKSVDDRQENVCVRVCVSVLRFPFLLKHELLTLIVLMWRIG